MTAYTEVIPGRHGQLLDNGKLASLSATAFSAQPPTHRQHHAEDWQLPQPDRHPPAGDLPIIRRSSADRVIAMNAMIEGDIYGNVQTPLTSWAQACRTALAAQATSLATAISRSGWRLGLPAKGKSHPSSPVVCTWTTPSHDCRSWSPTRGLRIYAGFPRRDALWTPSSEIIPSRLSPRACAIMHIARRRLSAGKHTPHPAATNASWHSRFHQGRGACCHNNNRNLPQQVTIPLPRPRLIAGSSDSCALRRGRTPCACGIR